MPPCEDIQERTYSIEEEKPCTLKVAMEMFLSWCVSEANVSVTRNRKGTNVTSERIPLIDDFVVGSILFPKIDPVGNSTVHWPDFR